MTNLHTKMLNTLKKIAIGAFAIFASQSGLAAEKIFQNSISIAPDTVISLDTNLGTVTINTWSRSIVQIRAIARHARADVLEALQMDIDQDEGGEFEIEIDSKSFWPAISNFTAKKSLQIDYEIIVPDDVGLDLDGDNTQYLIDAPSGNIEIEGHRNSARLSNLRGNLEIETSRGDIELNVIELAQVELEISRGSAVVNLHNVEDYRLDAKVTAGSISVVGREIEAQQRLLRSQHLQITEGEERNLLEVELNRGNLQLIFLN